MTRLRTGNENGFALVLTLVVTALMVAVTAEMIHQVYVDTSLSRGFRDGQQASLLAESGIKGGTKLVQMELSVRKYSALSDKWAVPLKLDDETGTIEILAVEESGKINLNGLVRPDGSVDDFTLKAFKRLGERLNIPDDCWSALADWLDNDNDPRSGGAETPYYKSLKPQYSAHNGPLTTLTELSLVKGFTPEIVAKLRPFVTIYVEQPGLLSEININTAPKEVLAALDSQIDDRMVERTIEERRLQAFKEKGELSRVPGLDTIINSHPGRVSLKGNVFRITSVARVKDTARTVEAVMRLSDGNFFSWQEY